MSTNTTPEEFAYERRGESAGGLAPDRFRIQVLGELSRHIDEEAEQSIRFTGKWHLGGGRAEWIATHGVQRTHPTDMILRELKQWTFALED